MFKKNIQVYIFQVQRGCDLNLIHIRVPQEDHKGKLLGKQVQNQKNHYSLQLICKYRSAKMSKATQKTQHEQCTVEQVLPEEFSEQEETSSDQEVFFNHQPSTRKKAQETSYMYMPYIEGPSMDWTVNDNLYNRFLK